MKRDEYVYLISSSACGPVKIGISRNPWGRQAELQTGNPSKLKLLEWWRVPDRETALDVERQILEFYSKRRLMGEWLNIDAFNASLSVTNCLQNMFRVSA
jgi:hypothetical protein